MLLDPALDRRIAGNAVFETTLWQTYCAGDVPETARALLILHMPFFARRHFGREAILQALPKATASMAIQPGSVSPEQISLDDYFAVRSIEFSALSIAMSAIVQYQPSPRFEGSEAKAIQALADKIVEDRKELCLYLDPNPIRVEIHHVARNSSRVESIEIPSRKT